MQVLTGLRDAAEMPRPLGGLFEVRPCVPLSCIMAPMFSRRSPFARIGTAILPLILLWGFVACLSLCSDHCTEATDDVAEVISQAVNQPDEEEACPVPTSPFLISRRADIAIPQMNTGAQLFVRAIGLGPQPISQTPNFITSLYNLPSLTDPPLERSGSLRI